MDRSMLNTIFYILVSAVFAALAWAIFHLLGNFAFPTLLVITIALLLPRIGRPKFAVKRGPLKNRQQKLKVARR
jgi:hypothetical protein